MHEGVHIDGQRIPDLEVLSLRLFERLQAGENIRVAFFGYTFFTARLIVQLQQTLGERFRPVCVIDNVKHGETSLSKTIPIVSFDDAIRMAPQIDLVAVMIDSASLYDVLGQIAASPLAEKEVLAVHRNTDPMTETEFQRLYLECRGELSRRGVVWYTDERNWYCLYQYLKQTAGLEGDIAEFGVFQGGSAYFLARVMRHLAIDSRKALDLYDTFEGIPSQSSLDFVEAGAFSAGGVERVRELLSPFSNVRIMQGEIEKNFKASGSGKLCLAHIDCDQLDPTRYLCEELYDLMVPGGILMFQNYSLGITFGERLAVDAFFKEKPEAVLIGYDGAAFVIKH